MIKLEHKVIMDNTGFLVADMQQNQHQKYLENCIKPSHSAPLILRSLPTFATHPRKDNS